MILDSNVLIDLIDPEAPEFLTEYLAEARTRHSLRINEIIFAEISRAYVDVEEVLTMLDTLGVAVERISLDECHRAGHAFAEYRRRGGERNTLLPDFLIGAQAAMRGWPLVTRDRTGFARYFPELEIVDPLEGAL